MTNPPEGAHSITLFAAFLADMANSVVGGFIVSQPEVQRALVPLTELMQRMINNPLTFHPGASYMQVAFNPLDVSIFEGSWALAHSYYLLSRTKPTMLQSPRIAQAGQSAMHHANLRLIRIDPELIP